MGGVLVMGGVVARGLRETRLGEACLLPEGTNQPHDLIRGLVAEPVGPSLDQPHKVGLGAVRPPADLRHEPRRHRARACQQGRRPRPGTPVSVSPFSPFHPGHEVRQLGHLDEFALVALGLHIRGMEGRQGGVLLPAGVQLRTQLPKVVLYLGFERLQQADTHTSVQYGSKHCQSAPEGGTRGGLRSAADWSRCARRSCSWNAHLDALPLQPVLLRLEGLGGRALHD